MIGKISSFFPLVHEFDLKLVVIGGSLFMEQMWSFNSHDMLLPLM